MDKETKPKTRAERNEQDDNEAVQIAVIANNIEHMNKNVSIIMEFITTKLPATYVTKTEFSPIKMIVYGMVGTILLGVLGALIALVVMK